MPVRQELHLRARTARPATALRGHDARAVAKRKLATNSNIAASASARSTSFGTRHSLGASSKTLCQQLGAPDPLVDERSLRLDLTSLVEDYPSVAQLAGAVLRL